jgi:hypothetical protein
VTGDFEDYYSGARKDGWFMPSVFNHPELHKHVGVLIANSEYPEVHGKRVVWVGVPYPAAEIIDEIEVLKCMVSIVASGKPEDSKTHIWCIVTNSGDTVVLCNVQLRRLLRVEINAVKNYISRTSDRSLIMADDALGGEDDAYVKAGKMMICTFGDNVEAELNFATPASLMRDPTQGNTPFQNVYPIPIVQNGDRVHWIETATDSINEAYKTGREIPNVFDGNPMTPAETRDVLRYFVHVIQMLPNVNRSLAPLPHSGDTDKIYNDRAFMKAIRIAAFAFDERKMEDGTQE